MGADQKDATRMAVMAGMAGIDMSMVSNDYSFPDLLIALMKEKQVPMTRIDVEAVDFTVLIGNQNDKFTLQ